MNSPAQGLPFNPIFLVSDPMQKYWLLGYFLLYFIPFLFGAMFLGLVFLQGRQNFGKVCFANMFGSGLGGISTQLALRKGAREVTVAEGNTLVVQAIRHNPDLARFAGHILENRKIRLIPFDGRIAIRQTAGNIFLSGPGASTVPFRWRAACWRQSYPCCSVFPLPC